MWRERQKEQEALERLTRCLVLSLIICATVVACTVHRLEQLTPKGPDRIKRERIQEAAMVQARWEASARARMEVEP